MRYKKNGKIKDTKEDKILEKLAALQVKVDKQELDIIDLKKDKLSGGGV